MGAKILLAEDEPYIVESLTFLLTREGHEVTAVADGGDVLPALRETGAELLILDIMMPTTNGFDILLRIRKAPDLADLPVLVLTAKGQEADKQRMGDLGANDFVTKPFSNRELLDRVASLLSPRAPRAAVNE